MDFTDSQAELIHQGINGVVADAQDRIGIDDFKQKENCNSQFKICHSPILA